MRAKRTLVYLALLVPSVLVSAIAWEFFAVGRLYYCSDSVPLLNFIPPFVHPVPDDHYIASPPVVYGIWFLLVAVSVGLPAIVLWLTSWRMGRHLDAP